MSIDRYLVKIIIRSTQDPSTLLDLAYEWTVLDGESSVDEEETYVNYLAEDLHEIGIVVDADDECHSQADLLDFACESGSEFEGRVNGARCSVEYL